MSRNICQTHILGTWFACGGVPPGKHVPVLQIYVLLFGTKTTKYFVGLSSFVHQILIIFAYSFIKLSIGFFLLRLADRTKWRPFLIGMLGEHVQRWQVKQATDVLSSLHWLLHYWLNVRHHLPVHPSSSRLGLHSSITNRVGSELAIRKFECRTNRRSVTANATTQPSSRTSESSTPPSTLRLTSCSRSSPSPWSGSFKSTSKRALVSP